MKYKKGGLKLGPIGPIRPILFFFKKTLLFVLLFSFALPVHSPRRLRFSRLSLSSLDSFSSAAPASLLASSVKTLSRCWVARGGEFIWNMSNPGNFLRKAVVSFGDSSDSNKASRSMSPNPTPVKYWSVSKSKSASASTSLTWPSESSSDSMCFSRKNLYPPLATYMFWIKGA